MLEVNKIYNGDMLEVCKSIEDKSIDLLLTDIPYDGVNRKSNGLRNLDKGKADEITFDLEAFLKESTRIIKGSGYIFCGWGQISYITNFLIKEKLSVRLCVWEKTNPSPMNGQHIWLSGNEFCVYFKNKNAVFNQHCKNGNWKFPTTRSKIHPTEKPLKLFQYLIESSSNEGDLVLDPCSGSGTCAEACYKSKRNFICIEKDEQYYLKSLKRMEDVMNV